MSFTRGQGKGLLSVENAVETESARAPAVPGKGTALFFAGLDDRYNCMKASWLFLVKVRDATFLDPHAVAPGIWVLHSFAAALYE